MTNHTINGATIARALSSGGYASKIKAVVPLRKDIYQITTVDVQSAQALLSTGIDLNGRHLDLKDELGQESVKVIIRGLPLDFPVSESANFLRPYGRLRSAVMPEKWQGTNILTGGHFAYMTIETAIPGRTTLRDFKISVVYKNQPRVCFKCTKPGHLARECPEHSYRPTNTNETTTEPKDNKTSPEKSEKSKLPSAGKPLEKPEIPKKPIIPNTKEAIVTGAIDGKNEDVDVDEDEDETNTGDLIIDEGIKQIRDQNDPEEGEVSEDFQSSEETSPGSTNSHESKVKSPESKRRRSSGSGKRRRSPKHR